MKKNVFWRLPLFWKIYPSMLLVLFLPMFLFYFIDMYQHHRDKEIHEPAGIVANLRWSATTLADLSETIANDDLPAWIRDMQKTSGLEIHVERDGQKFYAPSSEWLATIPKDAPPPTPGGPVILSAVSTSGRTQVTAALHPFRKPPPNPLLWKAAMFAVALFGMGLSYLLVRNFVTPLMELQKITRRLAESDLSARAGESITQRGDEIANLAEAFNWMAERVEILVQSQKRLLVDISHEIRSPLQRMDVALALTRRTQNTPSGDAEQYLNRVELEIRRIDEMVGELLALARAEAGTTATTQLLELDAIVASLVADVEFEERMEGKRVKTALTRLLVSGDAALIKRALGNVIRNAMRYTPRESTVEIDTCTENGYAVIVVSDSGQGVRESELDKIFLPYYRTDTARERAKGGTGLGLAITKRIVEDHGGSVAASNAPEGGLQVTIRLPLSSQ